MLARPVPSAIVTAVVTLRLPALALLRVPLVVPPTARVSVPTRPTSAAVPLKASTVLPL